MRGDAASSLEKQAPGVAPIVVLSVLFVATPDGMRCFCHKLIELRATDQRFYGA